MSHIDGERDITALSGGDLFRETGLKFEKVENLHINLNRQASTDNKPSLSPPAIYLPFKPIIFVRRDEYFEKLRAALVPKPGMFLLSGDPGSGKSTIAQVFASEVQSQFEAVVYQTCGQRSVETIVAELADTLKQQLGEEVTRLPSQGKVDSIRNWLQQRRALLILDDVWLDDGANTGATDLKLHDLLPNHPASILFTSRRPTLPWVDADHRHHLDAFTPEEVKDAFRLYLGSQTLDRYKEELLQLGERVERLPIAVSVAAQLLQSEFGPLNEAARDLKLSELRNQVHDVPGLLQRAIDAQGENEQKLLLASSVCAPEGFWLPLAVDIAGLDKQTGAIARDHLVNAGLLKLSDQDRQRFQLHSLLREQLHTNNSIAEIRAAHAQAVTNLFEQWETRWRDCRECLKEIFSAVDLLLPTALEKAWRLSLFGFSCAKRIGELETALQIEQQQERFWSNSGHQDAKNYLQASYGNQALILQDWGRLEEALALHKKEEAICLELKDQDGLQASYGNQALILQDWGRLEEALALHKKQEAISLELGKKDSLGISYGNQALILQSWGRLEEALALHKKEEAICLELGNKDGLLRTYGNQALILKARGRLEEAFGLLKKTEAICLELGDKDGLQRTYGNQAIILQAWGRLEEALALHKKEEAICLELGNKDGLQRSYGNQATILQTWGRLEEALALHKKKEAICLELGNKSGLAYCYWNWGLLAREMHDEKLATEKLKAALAIFTELKMPREIEGVKEDLNPKQASSTAAE